MTAGMVEHRVNSGIHNQRAASATPVGGSAPLRLLIVDDSAVDALRYRLLLGPDYALDVARTGAEGLERLQRESPDCVLLDYQLPDFDGLEFLRRLAAEHPQPMPAVVMLTGEGSEGIAVEAMKRGASDYLAKDPLSKEALTRSVIAAVDKQRLQRRLIDNEHEFEQFRYAVAHDLQAPLRRARQFCERLRQSTATLGDTASEYVEYIESNVESLQGTLRELLQHYSSARPEELQREHPAPAAQALAPRSAENPIRLLLVEDNPQDQLLFDCLLEDLQRGGGPVVRCEIARSGPQALELMRHQHYDAVVLDQQMPEMSGSDVMHEMQLLFAGAVGRPRILAYSNCDLPAFRRKCLAEGADRFLPKYMVAADLGAVLQDFGLCDAVRGDQA